MHRISIEPNNVSSPRKRLHLSLQGFVTGKFNDFSRVCYSEHIYS